MILNERSRRNLEGVHADLVRVTERAAEITAVSFIVTEGVRTLKRQKQLVAKGASQTLGSRHLTGHAVDVAALVGGKVSWDWPLYHRIADAFQQAGGDLGIPIESGANWTRFPDGPHHQLPRKEYPK